MNKKDFSYIWQGDTTYLILYKNKAFITIDLENFDFVKVDKIKTKKQERYYLNKIINDLIIEINDNLIYKDSLLYLDRSQDYYDLKYN